METIRLKAHIGSDGILRVDAPTPLKDVETEVLIVLQVVPKDDTDTLGWPRDFFAHIDAIEADDVIERGDQGVLETREPFE
jgi:hypothetical protein